MVPYKFTNATPPVSPTDIDAEKINANNDSLSNGSAFNDRNIKARHIDESSILVTYVIKRFIVTADLSNRPINLGLVNGDLVAVNDISSNGGKLYIVSSGQWVQFKDRILNLSISNKHDNLNYILKLDPFQEYVWIVDEPIEELNKTITTIQPNQSAYIDPVLTQEQSVKWIVQIKDLVSNLISSFEILAQNNNGLASHSIYSFLGDTNIDYNLDVIISNNDIVLHVINGANELEVKTLRLTL